MRDDTRTDCLASALLASATNALLVGVLFIGMLQMPGRDPNRLIGVHVMGWFIWLFPPLNIVCTVLALFGAMRPRLRRFTWGVAIGGAAFTAYLAIALFVTY